MNWIDADDYLPGKKSDGNNILVLLSNGERHFLGKNEIEGGWRTEDGKSICHVIYWMEIINPHG
jgi:hypothetical protein